MSEDWIDEEGFRANVGMIVCNRDDRLLWARRRGQRGWQFPQGGILQNESPMNAMYRELREEVGLEPADVELIGSTRGWARYRLPKRFLRRNSEPLCIGQKQRWFMLRLISPDDRIRFDRCESAEFDRWKWVDYGHPVEEVIYFKRDVYAQVLDEFRPLLQGAASTS